MSISVILASLLANVAFGVFIVAFFAAIVYGFYTRRGSGVDQHPQGESRRGSPGVAAGSSRVAGREDGEQEPLDTHGTK